MTNGGNARCFANRLGGCSTKLSREHYISRSILTQIHPQPIVESKVLGATPDNRYAISSLTVKILCTNHNHLLSPLDAEASKVFAAIDRFETAAAARAIDKSSNVTLDGALFERWLLKLAFGLCKGGVATGPAGKVSNLRNEDVLLQVLFGLEEWPDDWGLYIAQPAGPFAAPANFGLEPWTNTTTGELFQLVVWLRASEFWLCLGKPAPIRPEQYRPGGIRLLETGTIEKLELDLAWPDNGSRHAIQEMTRIGQQQGWAQR